MSSEQTDDEPGIILSGQMRELDGETQIKAIFDGVDVWLPVEEFRALVEMIVAVEEERRPSVDSATMESMKSRIDEATGVEGFGRSLFGGPKTKKKRR